MADTSTIDPIPDQSTSTARPIRVTWADLPLSCPRPGAPLWSLHPRVYLPIHETGMERCPYCSAVYVLDKADPDHPRYANIEIEYDHAKAVERVRLEADAPVDKR